MMPNVPTAETDYWHCGNCDYDLRGLKDARCPECGSTSRYDLDLLKIVRRRKLKSTITVAMITLLLGGYLQFAGLCFLIPGHNNTSWPLSIFFGPLGIFFMIALFLGFLLYPLYCIIISLTRRPMLTAKILFVLHYASALLGMCFVIMFGEYDTFSSNMRAIDQVLLTAPLLLVSSVVTFILVQLIIGRFAMKMHNFEWLKRTDSQQEEKTLILALSRGERG